MDVWRRYSGLGDVEYEVDGLDRAGEQMPDDAVDDVEDVDDEDSDGVMASDRGVVGVLYGVAVTSGNEDLRTDFSHTARECRSRCSRVSTQLNNVSRKPIFASNLIYFFYSFFFYSEKKMLVRGLLFIIFPLGCVATVAFVKVCSTRCFALRWNSSFRSGGVGMVWV